MKGDKESKSVDETRQRILLAAQGLFAEYGFESVSLRKITSEALANVAAVNYYFGSKESLIDELINLHTLPLMKERGKLLDEAEKKFKVGVVPVDVILDAFMRPFLTRVQKSSEGEDRGKRFCKFIGRCMSERGGRMPAAALKSSQKVVKRITAMLMDALPDTDSEVLTWRIHFCFGVMAHTLMNEEVLMMISRGECGEPEFEVTLQRMIDYCKGGLSSSSSVLAQSSGAQSEFFF